MHFILFVLSFVFLGFWLVMTGALAVILLTLAGLSLLGGIILACEAYLLSRPEVSVNDLL